MDYILHFAVLFAIYYLLVISLDLLVGHAGLVSMAQGAFFGLGAYTSALLGIDLGLSFLPALMLTTLVAIIFSFAVSLPSRRLKGDFFAIATFGFQVLFFSAVNNFSSLTRGALGISGVPCPSVWGLGSCSPGVFLIITTLFVSGCSFLLLVVGRRRVIRELHAIREDEIFARSLGKYVNQVKIVVCAASAVIAAIAGCLYASYITYIDPTSFSVGESILMLSMVVIGGAGSMRGNLLGVLLLIGFPELLREFGLPTAEAAKFRQIAYGLMLIGFLLWRPQGIVGSYDLRGNLREP